MSILQRLADIAAAAKKSNSHVDPKVKKSTSQKSVRQDWATTELSPRQKATICQLAKKAHLLQHDLGLAGNNEKEWRHEQQYIACRKSSLCECSQRDYLSLIAHFERLAGQPAKSKKTWSKTGRFKGSTVMGDTHENRNALHAKIKNALTNHTEYMLSMNRESDTIGWPYVWVIVKNKFAGTKIADLRADQLEQLFFTLSNRIAAKEGRGETKKRNKSQRK